MTEIEPHIEGDVISSIPIRHLVALYLRRKYSDYNIRVCGNGDIEDRVGNVIGSWAIAESDLRYGFVVDDSLKEYINEEVVLS